MAPRARDAVRDAVGGEIGLGSHGRVARRGEDVVIPVGVGRRAAI